MEFLILDFESHSNWYKNYLQQDRKKVDSLLYYRKSVKVLQKLLRDEEKFSKSHYQKGQRVTNKAKE